MPKEANWPKQYFSSLPRDTNKIGNIFLKKLFTQKNNFTRECIKYNHIPSQDME